MKRLGRKDAMTHERGARLWAPRPLRSPLSDSGHNFSTPPATASSLVRQPGGFAPRRRIRRPDTR